MNTNDIANLQLDEWLVPILLIVMLWTLFWKGLALWHSARKNDNIWFVILLCVNTLGILEIIYLFCFAKIKKEQLFK